MLEGAMRVAGSLGAGALNSLGSSSSSPGKDSEERFLLEPFSLVGSLALAYFYPDGIKPTEEGHGIKWTRPESISLGGSISISPQRISRTLTNLFGDGAATRKVIDVWQITLQRAICMHRPHEEAGAADRDVFMMAMDGLARVRRSYEDETDGTTKEIDNCIADLNNCLFVQPPIITEIEAGPLTEPIKGLWSEERKACVRGYLAECKQLQQEPEPGSKSKRMARKRAIDLKIKVIESLIEERCLSFKGLVSVTSLCGKK